jgi:hypothetical protein
MAGERSGLRMVFMAGSLQSVGVVAPMLRPKGLPPLAGRAANLATATRPLRGGQPTPAPSKPPSCKSRRDSSPTITYQRSAVALHAPKTPPTGPKSPQRRLPKIFGVLFALRYLGRRLGVAMKS